MSNDRAFHEAPWSEEDVVLLTLRQQVSWLHEYTCPTDHEIEHATLPIKANLVLIATPRGWYCPICRYRQSWCHAADLEMMRKLIADTRARYSIAA